MHESPMKRGWDLATFGFTLAEIRARADRERLETRALGQRETRRKTDRYVFLHTHAHGRRFAVTWLVTTTDWAVPSREDHLEENEETGSHSKNHIGR